EAGNPCVHYPGDYNVAVRGHRDITYRAEVLERAGVDTQIITLTTPGTHVEEPRRAIRLARLVNDAFAAIVRERSPRFAALATLPFATLPPQSPSCGARWMSCDFRAPCSSAMSTASRS